MTILGLLIPLSLALGLIGLGAFLWCLRNGQYEDLSGDPERIFIDIEDAPLPARRRPFRPDETAEKQETPT